MKVSKEDRAKFGQAGGPLPCTRLLVRELEYNFTVPAFALIVIADHEGAYTGANVYGGNFGKGYDPSYYTHPLPAPGDSKWKEWKKKGYEFVELTDPRFASLIEDYREQKIPVPTA